MVCRFESCAPNKFFTSYNVKSTCDLAKFQTQIKNKHTYKNLFISLQKKKHMEELKKDYLALLQKSALNGIDLYTLLEFGKMIHRLFPSQQIAAEIEAITKQHKPTVRVTSKPTGYAVYTPKPIEVAKKKAPITAAQYSVKEAVVVNEKEEPTFDNLKEWDANQYAEHFGDFDKVAEFAKDKLGIVVPEKISPMKLIKLIKTSLDASKD